MMNESINRENVCEECFKKEEEERYCDNEKCPYEGYCFGELKEQFEGKPYICEGCSTGIGVQEKEQEPPKCVDCDNIASINEYYPNGDHKEKYWTLCEECFKKDQEE
jgi:hypothetical protein